MSPSVRLGYGYALAAALLGSLMFVGSKWLLETLTPLGLASLMLPLATLFLTLWLLLTRGWDRLGCLGGEGWRWLAAVSVCHLFGIWCYLAGLDLLEPGVHAFLNRFEVLVTVFGGIVLLSERFRSREALGGCFVLLGLLVIRYAGGANLGRGFWLVMAGGVCFGAAEVLSKRAVRVVDPEVFAWARNILLSVAFMLLILWREGALPLRHPLERWLVLAAVALSGPVLARVLYLKALQRVEVSKAALLNQTQPLWVSLFGLLLLGSRLSWREAVGGAVILAGSVLLVSGGSDRPARRGGSGRG